MLEMSAKDFRQVIDIDLNGPFIVSKAVIPGMIKKGHGKIINICSMMSELCVRIKEENYERTSARHRLTRKLKGFFSSKTARKEAFLI
jgi:NAD(P)-dependent dehydrogenase (short-subunit alcohol dehydrogenase family)